MAYEKHDWATGEDITEALLDHMEQGIADAQNATTVPEGSVRAGSGLSVTRDTETGALTVAVAAKGVTSGMLADGVVPAAYKLPAATKAALGGVKQGAAVADAPEGADAAALRTTVNSLLAALRAGGTIAAN